MADYEVPGRPPGDSGGSRGRGADAYPLYTLIFLMVVMAALLAVAVWAGAQTR